MALESRLPATTSRRKLRKAGPSSSSASRKRMNVALCKYLRTIRVAIVEEFLSVLGGELGECGYPLATDAVVEGSDCGWRARDARSAADFDELSAQHVGMKSTLRIDIGEPEVRGEPLLEPGRDQLERGGQTGVARWLE